MYSLLGATRPLAYSDLEDIINEGDGTDRSVSIVRKYEPWLASWVTRPDEGQADAINKGWGTCTVPFLVG